MPPDQAPSTPCLQRARPQSALWSLSGMSLKCLPGRRGHRARPSAHLLRRGAACATTKQRRPPRHPLRIAGLDSPRHRPTSAARGRKSPRPSYIMFQTLALEFKVQGPAVHAPSGLRGHVHLKCTCIPMPASVHLPGTGPARRTPAWSPVRSGRCVVSPFVSVRVWGRAGNLFPRPAAAQTSFMHVQLSKETAS